MKWSDRFWIAALSTLVVALVIATAAAQADGPRGTDITRFTYEDLTRWILDARPEVATRPISLVLLWNRTDSVWGQGSEYQVLPNVWRNQLLSPLLDNFLVRGYERPDGSVQGDRITMLAFGRQRVDTIVPDLPFTRAARLEILNAYPEPYVDTPRDQWGLDLNQHLDDAIAMVRERYASDNLLLLLVTDPIQQGGETLRVDAARDFRTYRGFWTEELNREFTVYLYWNEFPNDVQFVVYDEARESVRPHPRTERASAQRDNLLPEEQYGTTDTPPLPQELTVALTGDGEGTVRSEPAGIDTTTGALATSFGRNSVVTLTAETAGRSRFAGFQTADGSPYPCGEGSGPGRCVVTMDVPRTVYGAFVQPAPFNWWPLIIAAAIVAAIVATLYVWLSERYEVRDERGLLDRTAYVFPTKAKRIPVPNPGQPSEAIGHLSVARPLPFGLSRLHFTPVKGYTVTLEGKRRHMGASPAADEAAEGTGGGGRRGRRSRSRGSAGGRKRKALTLNAGQRKPERQVLRYHKVGAPDPAVNDGDRVDEAATAEAGTVALMLQRLVGGRAGRQRKRGGKASGEEGRRGSRKTKRGRGKRRVELTDQGEGDGA